MRKFFLAVTLLCVVMCLPLIGRADSIPLTITGKGCWLHKNSVSNSRVSSEEFSWYITDASNMGDATFKSLILALNRPFIMSFSYKDKDKEGLQNNIDAVRFYINKYATDSDYAKKLVAVVWDYEPESPPEDIALVEATMKKAYDKAHLMDPKLPFGIAVDSDPQESYDKNGIDYKRAQDFADFLMPMLYCQWWACDNTKTRERFEKEQQATTLPLVVLTAIRAFSPGLGCDPIVITPQQILSNYSFLATMPIPPQAVVFYNVKDLDDKLMSAIKVLPW